MKIVVFGAHGILGRCIAAAFEARGHEVVRVARRGGDCVIDFRSDMDAKTLRNAVRGAHIVVNATGILIERDGDTWDLIHHRAVDALAGACESERVARIVHVSALGVGSGIAGGYMASKLAGELALARHGIDYAIVRPGLLVHHASASTRLFTWLSGLPLIALPGLRAGGMSCVSPIRAEDVAACVVRIAENRKALRRVIELAGEPMTYRGMLERYRSAQGKGRALWLPVPWLAMKLAARLAQALPQRVFSLDTMRMLQGGQPAMRNEAERWLGRRPALPEAAPGQLPRELASIG